MSTWYARCHVYGAGYWAPRSSDLIDNAGPGFIHVGTLAELRARCKAVSTPGRAVLVLSDGDDVGGARQSLPPWAFRCIAAASPTVFSLVAHSLTARSRYHTGEFARRLMTQFTKKVTRTRPDHSAKTGRDNVHGASLGLIRRCGSSLSGVARTGHCPKKLADP